MGSLVAPVGDSSREDSPRGITSPRLCFSCPPGVRVVPCVPGVGVADTSLSATPCGASAGILVRVPFLLLGCC